MNLDNSLQMQRKNYIGEENNKSLSTIKKIKKKAIKINFDNDLFSQQSGFSLPNVLVSPRESRMEHIAKKKNKLHKKIIRDIRLPSMGSSFL
jgi:hypothetical protein